jgi:trk system potassium uptake protein TrkA
MFVIIIGGGKVGTRLATLLLAGSHRVALVENRDIAVRKLQNAFKNNSSIICAGSGTDPELMESLGARQADVVAAVTGSDESNLVASSLAKTEFGVPRTIARINDPRNDWLFTPEMGVDVAVNQADLIAHLIAEEMSLGDMMTLLKLRKGQFSLVEEKVHPESACLGTKALDLKLPHDCVLTGIIREGQLMIPRGDTVLRANDEVLAVAHASQLGALAALLGGPMGA